MDPKSSAPRSEPHVPARRRLVGAAFGLPAVLTLHSGAALAASSSLRCLRTLDAKPLSPGAVTTRPSTDVERIPLYATYKGASTNSAIDKWYIAGSDIDNVRLLSAKVENRLLGAGQWMEVRLETNGFVTSVTSPVAQPSNYQQVGWVGLRVDPDAALDKAYIVGVVDGQGQGTAVWASCWSSIVRSA